MEVLDVELSCLEDNPYNIRLEYSEKEIRQLAESFKSCGQISPIKVRYVNKKYQVVFGHRRVRAARALGLKTIRAEVGQYSDQEMLALSMIENLQRKELSDYEKGKALLRLHESGMTYDEISSIVGYSKQHISNLIKMTELFDNETISKDPFLSSAMLKISEHHSRILTQIENKEVRQEMLKFVVNEKLSVRDLERVLQRFRSWFNEKPESNSKGQDLFSLNEGQSQHEAKDRWLDEQEIRMLLNLEIELPHKGDFETFEKFHLFNEGHSSFVSFPPYERFNDSAARQREREWFYQVAPLYKMSIRDLRIQFFGRSALATFYLDYQNKYLERIETMTKRVTVVFVSTNSGWKIIHEHVSSANELDQTRSSKKSSLLSVKEV